MRGRRDPQATVLAFVGLEERVPKDHPLRPIEAVADEEVVIAHNGKLVARSVDCQRRVKSEFGVMAGLVTLDDSFFEPLPEEELPAWES